MKNLTTRKISLFPRPVAARLPRLIALLTLALTAACAPIAPESGTAAPSEGQGPRPIELGVGFIPNVQFAPFYVGIEKGFFAENGIELSLEYGFENDYLKLVATDEMQFMIASGDQLVLGRAQELPVRYVLNWYTSYPVTVFAKTDAGIHRPEDLAGHRVGVPGPFGANYIALRALLDAAGLTEADIQMESIGFTQASAVSEGLVDAAVDYAVNGPVVLGSAGIETVQITLDQHVQIPANGLVTNERTLDEEPQLVAAMVRALQKSIAYTLANPDDAFAIALSFVPEAGGENEAANRLVFDASLAFWQPRPEGAPGATTDAEWQAVAELLLRIGFVDRLVAPEEMYTNRFVSDQ
ncbi:MAG: ABC transporter substrate-binding protein [Caldilineaceae bacterium]|nr:ABC transporter substrate-binding protein [Caldilineaceae bacterium]